MRPDTTTAGRPTVVASSRPPSPTSSTATSTPLAAEVVERERGAAPRRRWRRAGRRACRARPRRPRHRPRRSAGRPRGSARDSRRGGARCRARRGGPRPGGSPPASRRPSPCRWCRRRGRCGSARSGLAERGEQRLDALEPGAHPGPLPAAQARGCRATASRYVMRAARRGSAKKARRRRRMSRSSRRSTTRSTRPCSSRNSERWKPSGSGWRIVSAITRGPAKPMSARGSARMRSPSMAKLRRHAARGRVGEERRSTARAPRRGAGAPPRSWPSA